MMPEIKCPKCGEVFTVDESGYAAIIGQVRNAEFHKELHEREAQLAKEKESELSLIVTRKLPARPVVPKSLELYR